MTEQKPIPNKAFEEELEALSHTPNLCSYGFRYGKTLQEVEREMYLHDARLEAESRQLKLF